MAVACIDTQLLIWGVQQTAREGQEQMIARSLALFAELAKERTQVIEPSVVVGEFLIGIPPDEHVRYSELIARQFIVYPYDLTAARHAARIWREKREVQVVQARQAAGSTRNMLRADTMIIGTALAAGATRILSNDGDIKAMAEGFLTCDDPAELLLQLNLLADESAT